MASTGVIGEPLEASRITRVARRAGRRRQARRHDGRGARHHDHRHLPEGLHAHGQARRGGRAYRRHGQGRRHDRARHGDHAVLRVHRRAGRRAGVAGAAGEIRRDQLQRHHRRQRHLDLRHADAVRHRRGGQARRAGDRATPPTRASPPSGGRSTRCCSISRSRSCATARGRGISSRCSVEGAESDAGGQAHRAVDRQFAAGQDGHRRRGRQLGPHRHGGRQGRREGRARPARHLFRRRPAWRTRACAIPITTRRRPRPT